MFDQEIPKEYSKERPRPEINVMEISDGLDFGYGEISGQQEQREILQTVKNVVHHNQDIIVPVQAHDDGCGDGREVRNIFSSREQYHKSLHRPKVFGGGVTMAAAAKIGVGASAGQTLNQVFANAADQLDEIGVDFGAHTDEKAVGEKCGCGAIDKAPQALFASLKYEKPIREVVKQLGGDEAVLDEVYRNIRSYVGEVPNQPAFSGKQVVDRVLSHAKIVKQLGGNHRERRFVINKVPNYTVDQRLVRQATHNKAQIFAVDDWRLAEIAACLSNNDRHKQAISYHSELVYTLAVAAVLTKGDLPVDMIEAAPTPVGA